MAEKLKDYPLTDGYKYFEAFEASPQDMLDATTGQHQRAEGAEPYIHPHGQVKDSVLGPWTRIGARTHLNEVVFGAYSYIVNDSSMAYTTAGKYCSI
ncbi:MAG: hypothetical protein AAF723_05810, partial [Pseudomonadota bacterium]